MADRPFVLIITSSIILAFFLGCFAHVPAARATEPVRLKGLAYGPYRDGQNPNVGTVVAPEDIAEDMEIILPLLQRKKVIRTYSSTHGSQQIPRLASERGISVWQGAWLSSDITRNRNEIKNLISLAREGRVRVAIVGNETLLRGDISEARLIKYINEVKRKVDIPVTTAETWNVWEEHPALAKSVDRIVVHIYPFWHGISINKAQGFLFGKYKKLKKLYPGKKIIIGETGWPSVGPVNGNAAPGRRNQRKFLRQFVRESQRMHVPYFYFSAFDERWKTERGVGAHWGILNSTGRLKPRLVDLLNKPTLSRSKIIYVGQKLSTGYDMGVNSSAGRTDWLTDMHGSMRMAYPAGQDWGAVFVTVGPPTDPPRPARNFSRYRYLSVELKGVNGGESVDIGIKDNTDLDDGTESKIPVGNLATTWRKYNFDLSRFDTADLENLYVVIEFVFGGETGSTVYFRNVRYR